MAEKYHILRISEKELKNSVIKKHLIALVELRLKLQKHKPHMTVSNVEYSFIRHHYSWRNVEDYLPKKKDRLKGEVGKYNGRRVCIRGAK